MTSHAQLFPARLTLTIAVLTCFSTAAWAPARVVEGGSTAQHVHASGAAGGAEIAPGVVRLGAGLDVEEVDVLIARLGDPSWPVRERAQRRLVELGDPALTRLEEARSELLRQSAEARRLGLSDAGDGRAERITRLESAIGGILAASSAAGRELWLRFEGASPTDVLEEMSRQAGVTVEVDEYVARGRSLSGEVEGLGWWPAFLRLCGQEGWDLHVTAHGSRVVEAPAVGRAMGGPVSVNGPLAVFARGAEYERVIALDTSRPQIEGSGEIGRVSGGREQFEVELMAYLEPRFVIGPRQFRYLLTEAHDDAGNMLLPGGIADVGGELMEARQGRPAFQAAGGEATWTAGRLRFFAPLRYPREPGSYLTLAGRVRGQVGGDVTELVADFESLRGGAEWRIAGEMLDVRLEPGRQPGRWVIVCQTLRSVEDEVEQLCSASLGAATLLDREGEPLRRVTSRRRTLPNGTVEYRIEFAELNPPAPEEAEHAAAEEPAGAEAAPASQRWQAPERPGAPHLLHCRAPRRLVEIDLPFRFERLPMP